MHPYEFRVDFSVGDLDLITINYDGNEPMVWRYLSGFTATAEYFIAHPSCDEEEYRRRRNVVNHFSVSFINNLPQQFYCNWPADGAEFFELCDVARRAICLADWKAAQMGHA